MGRRARRHQRRCRLHHRQQPVAAARRVDGAVADQPADEHQHGRHGRPGEVRRHFARHDSRCDRGPGRRPGRHRPGRDRQDRRRQHQRRQRPVRGRPAQGIRGALDRGRAARGRVSAGRPWRRPADPGGEARRRRRAPPRRVGRRRQKRLGLRGAGGRRADGAADLRHRRLRPARNLRRRRLRDRPAGRAGARRRDPGRRGAAPATSANSGCATARSTTISRWSGSASPTCSATVR